MVPNGHLMFEDVSFLDSTVAKMNALRKSGQFCDVRMQVCGRELMAHRAVLACCSPFLFELFNSECEPPGGISLVRFDDLHPVAMEILLNYAYTAQLKADKNLVREVYSAARKLKMERVRQVCGDYLLTKMDSQSAISYRKFASSMADTRILAQVDAYIQEHLLDVANHEDFLKLPRLKLEVLLEDSLVLPGNGRLYSKVIDWLQRCLWENGQPMESLMEQVQTLYYSADHRLHQDHSPTLVTAQEGVQRQTSLGSAPSASGQLCKYEWKYIASEKTTNSTYLCLAVLNGMLCVIMLHGRSSPQTSPSTTPSGTPSLSRSLSLEAPTSEEAEHVLQPMHYARSGLGTASLGGKLIAAGGYNREECLRTVERYDPQTDRWSFLSPMRTPRARFQMAVLRGQLYVMGGSNGQSDELSCGETYDPLADEWTPVPELRTNRCNAGVCALKGRLYVVGGSDPCGQTGLKNCDSFDPETKTWSTCAPLNTRRQQGAVCALDGFMYVIGGAESWLSNCLSSVERYDPDLDCWTPLAPMNLARRGAGLAVHQGWLVVVGGFDGSHALSSVEAYDPAADEWKMLGAMTTARSNAGVAVLGDVVCAVGGFDGNDFLNTMEVYELENNEWSPCAHAFSATPTLSL